MPNALLRAVQERPDDAVAWTLLATHHVEAGQQREAGLAYTRALACGGRDRELAAAAIALTHERLDEVEAILRRRLARLPGDVAARRMMAELGARLGRYDDAVRLLESCITLFPGFHAARGNLAQVLLRQGQAERALDLSGQLIAAEPSDPGWRLLRAAAFARLGRNEEAIAIYENLLAALGQAPLAWLSYGHTLKTVGRQADAVAAYRKAIAQRPALGEAWWSLANLKTVRFDEEDRAAMREALARRDISATDRLHLDFAMAKACEDAGEDEAAFAHYAAANAARRAQLAYARERTAAEVDATIEAARRILPIGPEAGGCFAPDPIFVLGMPRAGSTLIEQILSSHPLVEGTMELPDIPAMVRRLKAGQDGRSLADILIALGPDERRALGEEYLARTQAQRQSDRPFFIDKMPNNWLYVPFIRAILPQARIIDARRDPMACCWSMYRQHFARGQGFAYDLGDLGHYYRDYVRMMAALDAVEPGAVVRVQHEDLVADPEGRIARLLDRLGLPFDPRCLRFWETERAVRTASSEQVRQPIFTSGLDQWRRFERWLGPLREALGDCGEA
ncbi:sulfotransferase [Novosphingobium nitrogenifigens DSM 19370]|uniref:Sulfotransferase n=1 Tax=Novosphingobium nitrogenifigens DSM 19370 TaxID=983920 RepID=F1ZBT9_9SPHN|nr:sulfotransferase [Novosphingobium nitrogenifigens]EGD57984.1 sulfotransferase [Novosphingobium nitrogenifigens DSM 19370]